MYVGVRDAGLQVCSLHTYHPSPRLCVHIRAICTDTEASYTPGIYTTFISGAQTANSAADARNPAPLLYMTLAANGALLMNAVSKFRVF